MKNLSRLVVALAVLAAAALPQAASAVDTGSADFTRYTALGDSLTAGYCSGGLVRNCQLGSYPLLLWAQATGHDVASASATFQQPLVSSPGINGSAVCRAPSPLAPCGVLRLVSLAGGSPTILPIPGAAAPQNLNLPRPYDNLAVPGANVHDVLATVTGGFHDLVLRGQGPQVGQAVALHPTFATLWIGNNDALGAATSGIVIDGVTLTTAEQFDADYRAIAAAIASTGAKMAVANIADVTSIPFVTTVSRTQTIPGGPTVTLIGPNGPLQAGDFVLLSASSSIAAGHGFPGQPPLTDGEVLSAAEVATIRDRVNHYNATIQAVAAERNAALVDARSILAQVQPQNGGINVGGVTYTSAFLTGGVFSYDGVHPTAFGYAYVANAFIDAINAKFGGDIPPVDLYPFVFGTNGIGNPTSASVDFFDPQSVVFSGEAARSVTELFSHGKKPAKPRKPRH
jgi:lysophospholipase L1-like esterase